MQRGSTKSYERTFVREFHIIGVKAARFGSTIIGERATRDESTKP